MGSASKSLVYHSFRLSAQVCAVSQIRSRRGFVLITPCEIVFLLSSIALCALVITKKKGVRPG